VTSLWADPATPTQPGPPYQGPPPTAPAYGYPPQYGQPASYGYGYPAYGYPGPWGSVPPQRPQRPGQVITSAVLAFVQAGVVLIASLYLYFFTSMIGLAAQDNPAIFASSRMQSLTTEATVLALLQVLSVVLLIVGGVRALASRTRTAWVLAVGAHAVQVVLALYWAVRLATIVGDLPGGGAEGTPAAFTIFFAAAPVVGLGLLLLGSGRHWFGSPQQP
jgi:hypothetical protein